MREFTQARAGDWIGVFPELGMQETDDLYLGDEPEPGRFAFDKRVVRVFPDMIARSVPGYAQIVSMVGLLARRYAQDDSLLYDLGTSLGAVALSMSRTVAARGVRIVAVDNSTAMVERLEKIVAADSATSAIPIDVVLEDVTTTPVRDASVVVLNFVLQFIEPGSRPTLLRRIHQGLKPGGILILSEKVHFEDAETQSLQSAWHHDFKRSQGYSDLEIARKRDALEEVLRSESLVSHGRHLSEAGFQRVVPWFQAFNFMSLVAFV